MLLAKSNNMAPPIAKRTWSDSISSGSSMESLLSVLGHDSYESPNDTSDDEIVVSSCKVPFAESKSKTIKRTQAIKSKAIVSVNKQERRRNWQEWMIEKAKELRQKQQCEENRLRIEAEEEIRKEKEKRERLIIIERKTKEWMVAKQLANVMERKMKIHHENDKEISPKSKGVYQRWMDKKDQIEREKKRKDREQEKHQEHEREMKERKSTEAYEEWLKKARKRPKSANGSLGYTCGKLTGYYDTCTYPTPSFTNPLPWKPVEIPKRKPTKTRPKSAPTKRLIQGRYR
ncbi:hypothetical protein LSH36_423g02008 [Paralvinella palmiformis]|uniref:Coiled-coil domain-containing protein n=1 Tax=Paralvinella palmiformis TaxID=53620 RepID=A0AAD9JBN7_9ANNE|nr:hypothetical protein LSH36_423g02008 [Paralvinella palmiformis]